MNLKKHLNLLSKVKENKSKKELPESIKSAIIDTVNKRSNIMQNIKFEKEEIALIEQLLEMHIDMLECDADTDECIMSDLKEAEQVHYKVLKYFRYNK